MKKYLSFLLGMLILLSACSQATVSDVSGQGRPDAAAVDPGVTEAEEPDETDPHYVLPDIDLGGRSFQMIVGEGHNVSLVPEETGEALNDAKYAMEQVVEEGLNVEIGETETEFWGMSSEVARLLQSGDTTYDAVAMMDRFAVATASNGGFLSLASIDSVNLSEPYWGGPLADELKIGLKAYFAVSSMNLKSYANVACMYLNRRLAGDYNMAIPFDEVFEGKWTKDMLLSYAGLATVDLNGDGVMDASDRYTYGPGDIRGLPYQFLIGWNERVIRKDGDDMPYLAVYDSERYLDLLTVVHGMMYSGENDLTGFMNRDTGTLSAGTMFKNGQVLFFTSVFGSMDGLREMEDDFTLLPRPKYDATQARYISRTYDSTFYMIPVTEADPEFSGVVLDALSCAAYYDMIPVYLDTVLKIKLARDEQTRDCIEICFDGRTLEFAEAYLADYFMDEKMFDIMLGGPGTFVSSLEKNKKMCQKKLEKLVKALEKMG